MSAVLTTDNSILLNQIGCDVCQAIVMIQEQQPHLLLEKYRNIPWRSDRHQSGLKNKLAEVLITANNAATIQQRLQKFLKALLVPESFESQILMDLLLHCQIISSNPNSNIDSNNGDDVVAPHPVNQIVNSVNSQDLKPENLNKIDENASVISEQAELPALEKVNQKLDVDVQANIELENQSSQSSNPQHQEKNKQLKNITEKVTATSGIKTGITVLLLDAENLQLNPETEKFLTTICNSPIQIKVAFANWCRKGKLDAELHQRGYDLIHVPSGKDNADGKMIAFGSSICDRFPNAKEVLVCSSDNVMTNLCNHLQQNGLTVYRVIKQGCSLTVLENQSGKTWEHTVLPSIEQFINNIKDIIRDEESRTSNQWIKFSKLSKIFHSKYNIGVNQVVSSHLPGKTVKDVFISKSEFALHQLPEDSETYVTLFKMPQQSNNGDTQKGKKN
ncbi:NYN domain-containing protein [Brunnivagina elsteri]|uniref:NYN domain-containing protein n=1 Tax=Brunnivagina elsteri TaxID=1247191 RepID=UPI001B803671|nr:NYN domain-containing protein [Calothrix elsteri]